MIDDEIHSIKVIAKCGNGNQTQEHKYSRAALLDKGNFLKVIHQRGANEVWFAKASVVRVHIGPAKTIEDLVTEKGTNTDEDHPEQQ